MKLDRDTYEAWLLDRLEGRLSAAQERALDAFLAAHPDLCSEAGDLGAAVPRIAAEDLSFTDREDLKRHFPPQGLVNASTLGDHLVARMEGELRPEQERALDRFLYEHPEHARSARNIVAMRIPAEPVAMPFREQLEKHFPPNGQPDRTRITDFLIAAHEGDLDAERMMALKALVAGDASLQREERLVKASHIAADPVVYTNKAGLKKREGRVVPMWSTGRPMVRFAAAASLLLLLGMAWWLLRETPSAGGEVARKEAPVTPRASAASVNPVQPAVREQEPAAPTYAKDTSAPNEAPLLERPRNTPVPVNAPLRELPSEEEPTIVQQSVHPTHYPKPVQDPVAPVQQEAPMLLASAAPTQARTVRELLAAGVRERVLDRPADDRPLDGNDAVALADKGLKGLTRGRGGVQVERTTKRDRFKVRLGDGLAFSGSIGR